MARRATTIRIYEKQLRQLRVIAEFENRSLGDIFSEGTGFAPQKSTEKVPEG